MINLKRNKKSIAITTINSLKKVAAFSQSQILIHTLIISKKYICNIFTAKNSNKPILHYSDF